MEHALVGRIDLAVKVILVAFDEGGDRICRSIRISLRIPAAQLRSGLSYRVIVTAAGADGRKTAVTIPFTV